MPLNSNLNAIAHNMAFTLRRIRRLALRNIEQIRDEMLSYL